MQALNKKVKCELEAHRRMLSERIVARQYALEPKIWEQYGDTGREKSLRDMGYHLSYLATSVGAADPSLFVEYVAWLKVLFSGLGFPGDVLTTTLQCTRDALQETLIEEMAAVTTQYLDAGLSRLQTGPSEVSTFIKTDSPLADRAQQYLDALLKGERHIASRLVLDAVEEGVSIRDIYIHVFQPCQQEIGRLWQINQISVAREHYCTAATQLIMSQLYPYIFTSEKNGRRLVATCAGDELHEIGIRMVADFLEMEGWDTYYLGANTPADTVVHALEEHRADVLSVSATMVFHVDAVTELIERVRESDVGQQVKVLVGGYPFNVAAGLWRRVGADAYGKSAQDAVLVASRLVGEETQR
jgi:methanogenic corrinoid protein MtbC1